MLRIRGSNPNPTRRDTTAFKEPKSTSNKHSLGLNCSNSEKKRKEIVESL
jgi:hypothetical protein